jgi:hypothetical protein
VAEDETAEEAESTEARPNAIRNLRHRRENDAFLFALIVVAFIGSALALTFASDLGSLFIDRYYSNPDLRLSDIAAKAVIIRIAAAFVIIATLGLVTYLYAAGSPIFRNAKLTAPSSGAYDERMLEAAIAEINAAVKTVAANRVVTEGDRKIITEQLKTLVQESLPAEYLDKIDAKYGSAIVNQKISQYLEDALLITKRRLLDFQESLSRKAASSLAWGVITAVLGLSTLLVFIFYPPEGAWDDIRSIFHFPARLGVVAMIEIVAFFFLNQYKFTLLDLKYVNNELTNIEIRMLSLITAAKLGDKGAIGKILAELAKTERNFALKKGEVSIFQSGSGGDILEHAVIADLLKRIFPTRSSKAQKG